MPDEQTDQERHFESEMTRLENRIEDLYNELCQLEAQRVVQSKLLICLSQIAAHLNLTQVQQNSANLAMTDLYTSVSAIMLKALGDLDKGDEQTEPKIN